MATQRKLLGEIDRTLKKVNEGVDVFNDIWDKVYAASAQNQKEKHESDLKKEIKKLQRFRDQIKNWIGNSDVKDKKPLLEARKLIEQKMEEFKVCEKETKTKAYSKEGLAQIERLDPMEQAKQNTRMWLQDCLIQLNNQVDEIECDLERLHQGKGKNKHKSEIETLETSIARHKWHILKLEQLTRLLDNDALVSSKIDDLKEDIEYYIEANQDPDYMETNGEDDIYEVLDLDSLGTSLQVDLPSEQEIIIDEVPSACASANVVECTITSNGSDKALKNKTSIKSSPNAVQVVTSRPTAIETYATTASAKEESPSITPQKHQDTTDVKAINEKQYWPTPPREKLSTTVPTKSPNSLLYTMHQNPIDGTTKAVNSDKKYAVKSLEDIKLNSGAQVLSHHHSMPTEAPKASEMSDEEKEVSRLVNESFRFIPTAKDFEKPDRVASRNTYPVPDAYPKSSESVFDSAKIFEKLELDTLFFIFYHQQGTLRQHYASRELINRCWGYHKKYKTWFKRHEEPHVTQDFEQGTFIYFDYENGWCQRMKTDFIFEYSCLEDELQ